MSDLAYNLLIITLESLICKNIYSQQLRFFAERPDKISNQSGLIINQPELTESQNSFSNPTKIINLSETQSQTPLSSQNENISSNTPSQPSNPSVIKKTNAKNNSESKNQKESTSKLPHKKENISTIPTLPMKRFRSDSFDDNDDSPNKRKPHIPNYSLPSQYSSVNNLRESYSKTPERGSIKLQQVQEKRPLPINLENMQGDSNKAPQNIKQIELKPKVSYGLRKIKGVISLRKAYKIESMEKMLLRPPYEPVKQFKEENAPNPKNNDNFVMEIDRENYSRNDSGANEDENQI